MNKDLVNEISADFTVSSGDTIDTLGAEGSAIMVPVIATSTVTLTEGAESDGSDATAVGADYILQGNGDAGTKALNVVTYAATGLANIGYVGKERYVTVTVANPATDTTIAFIKGYLRRSPVS